MTVLGSVFAYYKLIPNILARFQEEHRACNFNYMAFQVEPGLIVDGGIRVDCQDSDKVQKRIIIFRSLYAPSGPAYPYA